MTNQELLELCDKYFIYNPISGIITNKIKRKRAIKGEESGCINGRGYRVIGVSGKDYYCHRIAFLMTYKYLPKYIDHINEIKHDNRINNLRECTYAQNVMNIGLRCTNTSGYKGISWQKDRDKWEASICANGKRIRLGSFTCKHEAAKAYNRAAKIHHGDFAYINKIEVA